jgi:hypothetical protein
VKIKISETLNCSLDYLIGIYPFKNHKEYVNSIYVATMENSLNHPDKISLINNAVIYLKSDNSDELNKKIKSYAIELFNKFIHNIKLTDIELYELACMIFVQIGVDSNGYGYLELYNGKRYNFKMHPNNIRTITLDLSTSLIAFKENHDKSEFIRYNYENEEFVEWFKPDSSDNKSNIYSAKTNILLNELLDMSEDDIDLIITMVKRMKKNFNKD